MNVNKSWIGGRLTKTPTLSHTGSGTAVCNFDVAVNEYYKDKTTGDKVEQTEYIKIVVWGAQAESCVRYLDKGRQVLVEGSMKTRSYEKDGVKKYITEVKAINVQFISGQGEEKAGSKEQKPDSKTDSKFSADDIPF